MPGEMTTFPLPKRANSKNEKYETGDPMTDVTSPNMGYHPNQFSNQPPNGLQLNMNNFSGQ